MVSILSLILKENAFAEDSTRITTNQPHEYAIRAVANNDDRRIEATVGADSTVRLWKDGKVLEVLTNFQSSPLNVAFLERDRLLVGELNGNVTAWDIASGSTVFQFRSGNVGFAQVKAGPSGRNFIYCTSDALQFSSSFHREGVRLGGCGDYIDDRRVIISEKDGSFSVLDSMSGKRLAVIRASKGSRISISDGGTTVATWADNDTGSDEGIISIWDIASASVIKKLRKPKGMSDLLLDSERDRYVAVFSGAALSLATVPSRISVLDGGSHEIVSIGLPGKPIHLHKTQAGKVWIYGQTGWKVSLDPMSGSFQTEKELFAKSNVMRGFLGESIEKSDAAAYIAAHFDHHNPFPKDDIRWLSNDTQALNSKPDLQPDTFYKLQFSDNLSTAIQSSQRETKIWDLKNRKLLKEITSSKAASSFACGCIIYKTSSGRSIKYLIASGEEFPLQGLKGNELKISHLGKYMITSDYLVYPGNSGSRSVQIWDLSSNTIIREIRLSEVAGTIQIATSDDDKLLALTAGGLISLSQLSSGEEISKIDPGQVESKLGVEFSDDDKTLMSSNSPFTMWDVRSGKKILTHYAFGIQDWLTLTPEGFFDASANGAKYLNVVQGLDVYSIDQAYQSLYRPDLVREKLAGDPDGKVRDAAAKLDLDKVIGSGKAPAARFTSPDAKATVSGTEVAAEVELTDAGGGVGKVEWRVNGTTFGIDDGGLARQAGGAGRTVRVRRTLPLGPGDAAVEVVAYNAGNLLASDPVRLDLTRPAIPAVAESAPRLFVLAAGINDYWDGRLRLRYAVPDAKALSEGLRQAGQGLYADVEVTTLLDADVTAAKLDQAFADLGRRMGPSDVFIFFIAGHGKTVDGHYHFIPWDFRYENAASIAQNGIDQSRFQAWLARVPARKSLLLTDTCESGSLTEDQQVASARGLDLVAAQQAATELLTRAVGRTVLAASTDDAPALEGYHGHGVFSYAVLDALSHAAVKSDGLITVTELAGYVDRRVPELSYAAFHQRQIPQMRIVGSNFPILTRIAAVPEAGGDDVVPDRPTHVVTAPVTVRRGADAASDVVVSLQPGSQVAVVRSADGWTLVARDGQKLGYVEDKNLARLQ